MTRKVTVLSHASPHEPGVGTTFTSSAKHLSKGAFSDAVERIPTLLVQGFKAGKFSWKSLPEPRVGTRSTASEFLLSWIYMALALAVLGAMAVLPASNARAQSPKTPALAQGEFQLLLERLRKEKPAESEKVKLLAEKDRDAALRFLVERFGTTQITKDNKATEQKLPSQPTKKSDAILLSTRVERFRKIESIEVGEFSIDLCQRDDGAFGLGEIRRGKLPLRRADFLVTWKVNGEWPVFERREGWTIRLRNPLATLTFAPEKRECAGAPLVGVHLQFKTERGPIVETASWEIGGSSKELSYFDGYRGWHAPPQWMPADSVPPTNPKLMTSLLQGTGFQFEHGGAGALLHFHTTPGDKLRNASRGEALEFETSFDGPTTIDRFVFVLSGDSRMNLWTRSFETVHAELRRAFGLPERTREIFLQWPPFSRRGFRETADECVAATAREGFTGASIDVIWDNADFHGGAKNMNVWDYTICAGYGGEDGLKSLVAECKKHQLLVSAWVPAGHLWSPSPVWKEHPDWVLLNNRGEKFVNPSGGIWHGALDSDFYDFFRGRISGVVQKFGLDGLWVDTHLSYAQQARPPDHAARLAAVYRDFIKAGARQLFVEGDASAFGNYAIGIDEDWEKDWGKVPEPDLYYGAMLSAGSMNPRFYLNHFRRYVAAGAPWVINWDFLFSTKLNGSEIETARREVRQVVQDYRPVKDLMVHRFAHEDGSGYTWTNDRNPTKVVWLLRDGLLPDGRRGEAGKVYLVETEVR